MKVVILAAGYATRLTEVTDNGKIAKTLLPIEVNGKQKPILHFLLDKVQALPNVDQLIVITNSLYIKNIYNSINEYSKQNNPTWLPTILTDGTIKAPATGANFALQMANEEIDQDYPDDILVMASDNYFEFSLLDMYYQQQQLKANYGDDVNQIACKTYPKKDKEFIAKNFGLLQTTANNQVVALQEKPGLKGIEPKSTNVSLALYMLNRPDLSLIEEYMSTATGKARDSIGLFINYLVQNTSSFAYPIRGKFLDIGTPEEYYSIAPYTSRFKI